MAQLKVFENIDELVTLRGAAKKEARHIQPEDLSVIENAALVSHEGRIVWSGLMEDLKPEVLEPYGGLKAAESISLKGSSALPAFVECHTHSVFAGDRSDEFEMRTQGVSYQEIAKQGGGILSTVKQTREASQQDLFELAQKRVDRFVRQGVASLEIKSGYGLDKDTELRMLKVAKSLKGPRVLTTFLGAHALPPEYDDYAKYIDFVVKEVLPQVVEQKLADRVDIFVENGYFDPDLARRYYEAAKKLGLRLTGHTDQLSRTGSSLLAAELGADSADHVVQVSFEDIKWLAKTETTCVLLPGADFYLKMSYPPARDLIEQGARVALATDFNPGSCPCQDLSFMGLLARLEMKMSLAQTIVAYTLGAAYALGIQSETGSLESGKSCDFSVLDGSWRDLFYSVGYHPVKQVWRSGKEIWSQP